MPQTESLLKLRSMTSETRNKVSHKTNPLAQKRSTDAYPHAYRTQNIVVAATLPANSNTQRFKVPSFNSVVQSMWITVDMPACTQGDYDPSAMLKYVKRVSLRHSTKFFEYEPAKYFPILLNRDRNVVSKAKKLACFGNRAVSAAAETWLLPIIHPFDQWLCKDFYEGDVKHGARSKGAFRCDLLKEELVVEIELADLADYSNNATQASAPSNLKLYFTEIVSPNIEQIKAALPTSTICNVYTHLANEAFTTAEKTVKLSGAMARAPTENIILMIKDTAASVAVARDPFSYCPNVDHYKVTCDGRELLNSEELDNDIVKSYEDLRNGRTDGRGDPNMPIIAFGPHPYGVAHTTGVISNTACNTVEVALKCKAASTVTFSCEQCQSFAFKNGTIVHANSY
jgi:hypothetical protein